VTATDALSGPQVRGELAIAAAEAGAGFALADTVQAGDALMSGRLVRPFEATVAEFSYSLVHAEGARLSKTAQAFAMWIKGECSRFADEFSRWEARTTGQRLGHARKAKGRSRL
jgi:LysR family glycine cleavage system transcriptional activator